MIFTETARSDWVGVRGGGVRGLNPRPGRWRGSPGARGGAAPPSAARQPRLCPSRALRAGGASGARAVLNCQLIAGYLIRVQPSAFQLLKQTSERFPLPVLKPVRKSRSNLPSVINTCFPESQRPSWCGAPPSPFLSWVPMALVSQVPVSNTQL